MKRREFITMLSGTAVTWPLAARAQQPRIWRIGYISVAKREATETYFQAFRQALAGLGYVEGKNIAFLLRWADGHFDHLATLTSELVAERPDVIAAVATPAVAAAQRATSTIPIVMLAATDPIGSGFVNSLARPGGNVTGVSNMSVDVTAKALQFLRILLPNARRIAVLMSPNPVHPGQYKEAQEASRNIGVTLVPVTATTSDELVNAFAAIARQHCDALLVLADPPRLVIVDLAAKAGLPAIFQLSQFVKAGGLISYGTDFHALFRRGAFYVDRIFKGANAADLPVEQPTKFELLINLKTAKALGLGVPATLLAIADEVIE
jgi:putative tryptophan/tyrosine transport system substrate-binding protein